MTWVWSEFERAVHVTVAGLRRHALSASLASCAVLSIRRAILIVRYSSPISSTCPSSSWPPVA